MTKYVLNSGGLKNQPKLKKKFHREIIIGLGKTPKFLLCNFAQGREYWEPKFTGYSEMIAEDMPNGVKPTFELAIPDEFEMQCKRADAIYFHGGDDTLLRHWLEKFNFPNIWEGKVVATNSASSDALSSHFWTCDWRKCMNGLRVLPIKFIPHFKSNFGDNDPRGSINWDLAKKELEVYGDKSLPIYALQEGEYVVFEQ